MESVNSEGIVRVKYKPMKLRWYSDAELVHSVFYPACGVDWRPILSFTHVSNLFIYADWAYTAAEVYSSLTAYLENINAQLHGGRFSGCP